MKPTGDGRPTEPDPIDEAAAEIDPRSSEAPEQIEDLKELAESLGRDVEDLTAVESTSQEEI